MNILKLATNNKSPISASKSPLLSTSLSALLNTSPRNNSPNSNIRRNYSYDVKTPSAEGGLKMKWRAFDYERDTSSDPPNELAELPFYEPNYPSQYEPYRGPIDELKVEPKYETKEEIVYKLGLGITRTITNQTWPLDKYIK